MMARRTSSGAYRRRRWWIRFGIGGALVLLGATVLADHLGVFGDHGDDASRYDRVSAMVIRVIDGDNAVVRVDSDEVMIHLLGIDAPDMNFGDQQAREYWSTQARNYLLERMENKPITLKLDPRQMRDQFGRLLVYAYLSDTDNVNMSMVRDGYAYADRRVNHPLAGQFEAAEAEARRRRRGLWREITMHRMPAWRQHWLQEQKKGNTEP